MLDGTPTEAVAAAVVPQDDAQRSASVDVTGAGPSVAVVGSGPSGCYVSQFLAKRWPGADVTIFETLPAPYGLIRYGVAADHQGAKAVSRQFDRLFTRSGVRFAGNVTVGRDVTFHQLAAAFDIVVIATGLPADRTLEVAQHPRCRILGAGALLRALNGFPLQELPRDDSGEVLPLGRHLAVVGMGNVAIDVIRLLAKDIDDFHGSDIDDDVLAQLRHDQPSVFDVIGRSPAAEAKFDLSMLRELVSLPQLDISVTGLADDDVSPVAQLLRPFTGGTDQHSSGRIRLNLHFGIAPQSVDYLNGRTVLHAQRRGDHQTVSVVADSIITAIGFTHAQSEHGLCAPARWEGPNVYRVGWFSRGATGTIPENRKDAQRVAEAIDRDVTTGRISLGRAGFRAVEPLLADRMISFADWQRIEAFERQTARRDRCRRKIADIGQMIAIATTPDLITARSTAEAH